MNNLVLIDYGSGNLHSARKALLVAAQASDRPHTVTVTADPDTVAAAERIVLPGVGAFGACMAALAARPGLIEALRVAVIERSRPFLGICVGMQLLATTGEEHGTHEGLGWIPGSVTALPAPGLKVPHMGWNDVIPVDGQELVGAGDAYYVHSYRFVPENENHVAAWSDYGEPFAAAVRRDNIAGVQFHPEKSQRYGLDLLSRFLDWSPV